MENQSGLSNPTGPVLPDPSTRTNVGGNVSGEVAQGWVSNPGDENEEDSKRQAGNNDRPTQGGGNKNDNRHQPPAADKFHEEDETLENLSNGNTSQASIPETTGSGGGWGLMKLVGGDESAKLTKSHKDKQKDTIRTLNQKIDEKSIKIKELKD